MPKIFVALFPKSFLNIRGNFKKPYQSNPWFISVQLYKFPLLLITLTTKNITYFLRVKNTPPYDNNNLKVMCDLPTLKESHPQLEYQSSSENFQKTPAGKCF